MLVAQTLRDECVDAGETEIDASCTMSCQTCEEATRVSRKEDACVTAWPIEELGTAEEMF